MNNLCIRSIEESIKNRYSVRSYSGEKLSEEIIEEIEEYVNTLDNPFDIKVIIRLVKKEK